MKIRADFVTNSSSSSYITIGFRGGKSPKKSFTFERDQEGWYCVGIEDTREELGAATTTDEVAGILERTFYPNYDKDFLNEPDFAALMQEVRNVADVSDLGVLEAKSSDEYDGSGTYYEFNYDFSDRTGTLAEASVEDDEVTFNGDPFCSEGSIDFFSQFHEVDGDDDGDE